MKSFIIDDDQISLFLTQSMLEIEGFSNQVSTFLFPEDALEVIQNCLPDELPSVIFLDLNMPHMNGWSFMDAVTPLTDKLKDRCRIYILTSSLDSSDDIKAKDYALIHGFIHKPITGEELKRIQADFLKETERS